MRALLVLAAVGAALAASGFGGATTPSSGIIGTVVKGPTRPVCQDGEPCTAPAGGVAFVIARNGAVVARVVTRRDGTFRVALPPGRYVVRTAIRFPIGGAAPQPVEVRKGRFTRVRIEIDTGIR